MGEHRSSSRHHCHRHRDDNEDVHISRRESMTSADIKPNKREDKNKVKTSKLMLQQTGRESHTPEDVLLLFLKEFPGVACDLQKLLQMIDDGQAVDIGEISERCLVKPLKKLFLSLNLMESGHSVFLLPSNIRPTLDVVGSIIYSYIETNDLRHNKDDSERKSNQDVESVASKKRFIGPAMPSAELLAAAAKLTNVEAELREAELLNDTGEFIGPPPPSVVSEAESANEAERFEEITRILSVEIKCPYDVVGVNSKMPSDNIKKRFWKLSLMVHPDKCSHPQAHEAFIKLNKAFKDLQNPEKRKELDSKIKVKEEEEALKAEMKVLREAAQWRQMQGISMVGDDVLLAEMDVRVEPKRDEWMTTLPPERKAGGMPMQSTSFSRNTKEGRGDTSAWTDAPSDRAQKAKTNYVEAYNQAASPVSNEEKKRTSSAAEVVDRYNESKRSKSLVQKHREKSGSGSKRKESSSERSEWQGSHPWKPWDRENDLAAGRQSVKLDPAGMPRGLSSRFSSGTYQRNFL